MLRIKKLRPIYNQILTTMERYAEDQYENGIALKLKGSIREYQKVLAIGNSVRNVEVGDVIVVNPTRYMRTEHRDGRKDENNIIRDDMQIKYNFHTVEVDGKDCLLLFDSDVDFIIEDFDEVIEKKGKIIKCTVPKILIPEHKIVC